MKKGRLTQKEHERRLKLLLEFIFIFRYATVYGISEFSRIVIGITYARWLIYYASKRGLIRSYFEPLYRIKIYYLTAIGKGLIYEQEALIEHYNFEKKHTGVNAFQRHRLIVNAYLNIAGRIELNLRNWESDWILRIGKKKREPAVIFIDTINRANPTPEIGLIEATNPCGEVPLLPYESCNLGSINLSKFYKKGNGGIDMDKLGKTVRLAIRFLDNVIDANKFPIPEIKEMTQANRKIGLGVMGFADLLLQKGIKDNSLEATVLGEKLMKFIHDEGFNMSIELAKERGNFPNISKSIFKNEPFLRNATITSVAPTGTISLIASASQGIEPIYSVVQTRHVAESLGKNLIEVNPAVKRSLELKGMWTPALEIALLSSQSKCMVLPKEIKDCLVTAHQVSPEWHVKMQAAFQKYTDNSISKTVNLPTEASTYDIEQVYQLAFKLGCKGITVYRDKSRNMQVLTSSDKCLECSTGDVVPPIEELKKLVI